MKTLPVLETPPAACCTPLDAPTMSTAEAEATASLFKALADPARVRIVNMLATAEGDVCVCDFTPQLGLAQPTVSHHLRKLADAGLLRRRRQGTWAFYSLDREALARLESVTRFSIGVEEV